MSTKTLVSNNTAKAVRAAWLEMGEFLLDMQKEIHGEEDRELTQKVKETRKLVRKDNRSV
jgi:hypothetical protein